MDRRLVHDLARLYILHRSAAAPVGCDTLTQDLRHHGVPIDARSVAQLLHALCRKGYLKLAQHPASTSPKRTYTATGQGHDAVVGSRTKLRTLYATLSGKAPGAGPFSQP
ncbi:MAG: hypothetical protein QM757_34450 [Paludibaculum sp.]